LIAIMDELAASYSEIVFPVHPRIENRLREGDPWDRYANELRLIEPAGYPDFIRLLDTAERVVTDSGVVQKEAFFLDTFCITLREVTKWPETIETDWNVLVGADPSRLRSAMDRRLSRSEKPSLYGNGNAAERVVETLEQRQG
jgi:UDP-N-acetylglucosamine 2-epimerase (non-hydrolysing)